MAAVLRRSRDLQSMLGDALVARDLVAIINIRLDLEELLARTRTVSAVDLARVTRHWKRAPLEVERIRLSLHLHALAREGAPAIEQEAVWCQLRAVEVALVVLDTIRRSPVLPSCSTAASRIALAALPMRFKMACCSGV